MSKSTDKPGKLERPNGSPTPSDETRIRQVDDVVIQVTQAFCPNGHNLIGDQEQTFDGAPGIGLWVSDGTTEGEVVLSPYHGDHRRITALAFEPGTTVTIACPVCKAKLPRMGPCTCPEGGDLCMVYLTERLDEGQVVALCNVWGCHRSKVFDQAQLLSAYVEE